MTQFDLLLVGHGNVAKRFVSLLAEQKEALAREYGLRARIIGIATRRHGQAYSAGGVKTSEVKTSVVSGFSRTPTSTRDYIRRALKRSAAAARTGRLVVIETTTLDIESVEPAIGHIRTALAGSAHVVTANKGPVAFAYHRLAQAAERADRRFLFEGAVKDGVPIFNLVRETLPSVRILGFPGVVNSTTNFILTAMEQGRRFEEALAEMQACGVAEADASLDVDGWDAAAKAAALANVLLGANITPKDVERRGNRARHRAAGARGAGRGPAVEARGARRARRATGHGARGARGAPG